MKNEAPEISLWYGTEQFFGMPGNTQKFINILGNISNSAKVSESFYTLNNEPVTSFALGSDQHRLAKPGDFNIEFTRELLKPGINTMGITVIDNLGKRSIKNLTLHYTVGRKWPLPYSISWDTVKNIQNVVQVLDGKWEISNEGVRVLESYYDRTLAFGDASWKNYEVTAEVVFHDFTSPYKGAPNYNVTHAAIASRWPGFDNDEFNPHRKWFPLGATCEFRLTQDLDSCSFRILAGGKKKNDQPVRLHKIELDKKYVIKTSTQTTATDTAIFKAKFWVAGEQEPETWDIEYMKSPEEVESGCALLIAHHSVVSFGKIEALPLQGE